MTTSKLALNLLLLSIFPGIWLSAQQIDPNFQPEIFRPGFARRLALQSSGNLLVGGNFTYANGQPWQSLARFLPDGEVDESFSSPLSASSVRALSVQPDNRILIGGIIHYHGIEESAGLIKLQADGSLDPDFNQVLEGTSFITSVCTRSDGKIVVGGTFNELGGLSTQGLLLLNEDGSIQQGFNIAFGQFVGIYHCKALTGNQVVVAGRRGDNGYLSILDVGLQPVNTFNFTTGLPDGDHIISVDHLDVLPNGHFFIAGTTHFLQKFLATVNPEGVVQQFRYHAHTIRTIHHNEEGELLVATHFNGKEDIFKYRPEEEFLYLESFLGETGYSGVTYAMLLDNTGNLMVGGSFADFHEIPADGLVRIGPDDSPDPNYSGGIYYQGRINALAHQPDGKILIGGNFNLVNGQRITNLARLHPDGSLDNSFQPKVPFHHALNGLKQLPDGRVVVNSDNTSLFSSGFYPITLLHSDGNRDTTFQPGINAGGAMNGAFLTAGNQLLTYGNFAISFNNRVVRNLALYNLDGSLDTLGIAHIENLSIYDAVQQADGKIILAGRGLKVNAQAQLPVLRLNSDLSPDPSFTLSESMGEIAEEPLSLNLLDNEQLILSGNFVLFFGLNAYPGMTRLNQDGSWDHTFFLGDIAFQRQGDPAHADRLIQRNNGDLVAAGYFDALNATPVQSPVLLYPDGSFKDPMDFNYTGNILEVLLLNDSTLLAGGSFWNNDQPRHTSLVKYLFYEPVAVKELVDDPGIHVFPNPAIDHLQVELEGVYGGNGSAEVYNSEGLLLFQQTISISNQATSFRIPLDRIGPGVYLLKFRIENQVRVARFVKGK